MNDLREHLHELADAAAGTREAAAFDALVAQVGAAPAGTPHRP